MTASRPGCGSYHGAAVSRRSIAVAVAALALAVTPAFATPAREQVRLSARADVAPLVVRLKSGAPVGGVRKLVRKKGQLLRFVVYSDRRFELHVHGYEIERIVAPGKPARFAFVARFEGVFEVELHPSGRPILKLVVNP